MYLPCKMVAEMVIQWHFLNGVISDIERDIVFSECKELPKLSKMIPLKVLTISGECSMY